MSLGDFYGFGDLDDDNGDDGAGGGVDAKPAVVTLADRHDTDSQHFDADLYVDK
jgi:hypothetical protein